VRREQQRQRFRDAAADAAVTFREAAEAFIRARKPNWKNRYVRFPLVMLPELSRKIV
jgi:hypothetical protein